MLQKISIRKITLDEVSDFYDKYILEYFPEDEVKPLKSIVRMMEDGLYQVLGVFDDNISKGCAFVTTFPGGRYSLLDYLAVDKESRGQGYGGILLKEAAMLAAKSGPIMIETETLESAESKEELHTRQKRNRFYQTNGALMTNLVTDIFGVEYNVWLLGHQQEMDLDSFSSTYELSKEMIGIYRYMVSSSAYGDNVHVPYIFNKIINGIEVKASYTEASINEIFLPLLERLTDLQRELGRRIVVMLAAPPGAGKSTLCEFLQALSQEERAFTNISSIGMDGFHRYQDYLLSHTTLRDGQEIQMVKIKGAPITFDVDLLKDRIKLVKSGEKCGWPVYNRLTHNPQDGAITVDSDIVIIEGNYLLLDEEGWDDISKLADYTIRIDARPDDLFKRLVDRKVNSGNDLESAKHFVEFSDMRNVMTCLEHSKEADLNLVMKENGEYYDKQLIKSAD